MAPRWSWSADKRPEATSSTAPALLQQPLTLVRGLISNWKRLRWAPWEGDSKQHPSYTEKQWCLNKYLNTHNLTWILWERLRTPFKDTNLLVLYKKHDFFHKLHWWQCHTELTHTLLLCPIWNYTQIKNSLTLSFHLFYHKVPNIQLKIKRILMPLFLWLNDATAKMWLRMDRTAFLCKNNQWKKSRKGRSHLFATWSPKQHRSTTVPENS